MKVLAELKQYGNPYVVVDEGKMDPQEVAQVTKATIVESDYGFSVCMFLTNGRTSYIPLDEDCMLTPNDKPDLTKGIVKKLIQEGNPKPCFKYFE